MLFNVKRVAIVLLIMASSSCNNSKTTKNVEPEKEQVVDEFEKFLQEIEINQETLPNAMAEKGIKLVKNGICDDALDDTLHKMSKVYIDTLTINESVIASFKFKEACCQDYLADYEIVGDTMIVSLGLVSNDICACICWYRYRYETKSNNVKYIKFKDAP